MAAVAVLSAAPRRPRGGIFEGTSAEVLPYPFELKSSVVDLSAKRKDDLGAVMARLWETPLGSYGYTAVEPSLPSSTVGNFIRNVWTGVTTSTSMVHTPLLIAGADLAPSFTSYLSNLTATTPTTLIVRREYLGSRFSAALVEARGEKFEFGTDSQLSQRIGELVLRFGGEALATLAATVADSQPPVGVLGELLRTIGRIRSATVRREQRSMLLRFLESADLRVRHVAATGLAALDDPAAIPALRLAIASEPSERLRTHLRHVLRQLEATGAALRHW